MPERYFRKKTKFIFFQFLGIGVSFFALFFILWLNIYPKIFLIWQSIKNKLSIGCGCANHFSFIHHPYIFTSLIIAGVITALAAVFLIWKIFKIRKATRHFIKNNLKNRKIRLTPKLWRIARINGLEKRIIEVQSEEPIIFCFGLFRPKICISSRMVKSLSKNELRAVIGHERHHLSVHDPIKLFFIKLLAKILFFIPGFNSISRQYLVFSELAADEGATDGFQNKEPLSAALYRIIKWQERAVIRKNLAVSFFDSVLEERINKLADNEYRPGTRVFSRRLIMNMIIPFALLFALNIFLYSSNSKPVATSDISCISQESANSCQMTGGFNCKMKNEPDEHFCQVE